MKWCCVGFKLGYEAASQRGTAYLIGRDAFGKPEFILQFRAFDEDKEFPSIDLDFPVSTVIDIRILFCPTCGCNLEKQYGRYVDSLHRKDLRISEAY